MFIKTANYIGSYVDYKACPDVVLPEFAFIGRSNVGKSSLINMLTDQKQLAKTSSTPGKTQTINYFTINNDSWFLVDLPGFGYARTAKSMRSKWKGFIRDFLIERLTVQCVFLLIDVRITPQKIDIEFANWMGEKNIPFVLVFTKAEKTKTVEVANNVEAFKMAMLEFWDEVPQYFISSSISGLGKDEILEFIDNIVANFEPL